MSKDEEKYTWNWPSQIFPIIDPHSKIKHQIIDDYLQAYVHVLMRNAMIPRMRLSIIDGFCGGGRYRDEDGSIHYGSPIIALKSVKEAVFKLNIGRQSPREFTTQNFFVDINKNNADCLNSVLKELDEGHRIGTDIHIHCEDFSTILPRILPKVRAFGDRAIFLLDQYAYGDVPFDDIQTIFRTVKNAEVLLTFNIDALITYLSDKPRNRKAIANIGLERHIPWEDLKSIKVSHKHEWQYLIQRYLSKGILEESGAEFMTIFFVTPLGKNSRTYWFIHLANSYRANEVMKSIHWQYGNNFSHSLSPSLFVGYDANRDINVTDQHDLSLGEEHHFDGVTSQRIQAELSEILPRAIYETEEQTFEHLMRGIANFTMANEEIVKGSLEAVIASGDVEVKDKTGKTIRRKSSSIIGSDRIVASPQRPLFFLPRTFKIKKD
ncbi:MAG: hypothetical protein JWM78_957 [Verrucomicrobiaceae bacterium]|nr:hypothetical protein [Verrucomicrobiaceae bacterium]